MEEKGTEEGHGKGRKKEKRKKRRITSRKREGKRSRKKGRGGRRLAFFLFCYTYRQKKTKEEKGRSPPTFIVHERQHEKRLITGMGKGEGKKGKGSRLRHSPISLCGHKRREKKVEHNKRKIKEEGSTSSDAKPNSYASSPTFERWGRSLGGKKCKFKGGKKQGRKERIMPYNATQNP